MPECTAMHSKFGMVPVTLTPEYESCKLCTIHDQKNTEQFSLPRSCPCQDSQSSEQGPDAHQCLPSHDPLPASHLHSAILPHAGPPAMPCRHRSSFSAWPRRRHRHRGLHSLELRGPLALHVRRAPPRRHVHARAADRLRRCGAHCRGEFLQSSRPRHEHRRQGGEQVLVLRARPRDLKFGCDVDLHDVARRQRRRTQCHVHVLVRARRGEAAGSFPRRSAETWMYAQSKHKC